MDYDHYIVLFSGGKDSIAIFLNLLQSGVAKEKIELWHHDIDGRESNVFMDWPVTPAYCRAFAAAFGVKIFFSWKEGGFEREMLRNQYLTAPTKFENDNGEVIAVGGVRGKLSTRMKFPQVSPDLNVRWCSAYLKIDIGSCAIRNQGRFYGKAVAVLSGERGEESPQRAKYAMEEPDRADLRYGKVPRLVDRLRPIRDWSEAMVWDIIALYSVRVHPCYYMGWNRCSCRFCIFGNENQFASAAKVAPEASKRIVAYEDQFGVTLKRKESLSDLINRGTPYAGITDELINISNSKEYHLPIFMDRWELPSGAFGESNGPN